MRTHISKDNYDGYRFHLDNIGHIYNSALSIFFMLNYLKNQEFIKDDSNVQPSETFLKFIARHSGLPRILSDRLSDISIVIGGPIDPTIKIDNLLNEKDTVSLLSYLFYHGFLTLGENDFGEKLKLPNECARELFNQISKIYFSDTTKSIKNDIDDAVKQKYWSIC